MKDGDLNRHRPLTGSVAKEPAMEEYSLDVLKSLSYQDDTGAGQWDQAAEKHKRTSSLPPPRNEERMSASYREKYPNIASLAIEDIQDRIRNDPNLKYQDELDAYSKYKSHGFFTPNPASDGEGHPKERIHTPKENNQAARESALGVTEREAYSEQLRWERDGDRGKEMSREQDRRLNGLGDGDRDREMWRDQDRRVNGPGNGGEAEATRRRGKLHGDGGEAEVTRRRVKGPGDGGEAEATRQMHRRTRSVPEVETFPTERALPDPTQSIHQSLHPSSRRYDAGHVQTRLDQAPKVKRGLFKILDLVDRYWNGSKSLHQHAKFLALALDEVELLSKGSPLAGMEPDSSSLRHRVDRLQEENTYLQEHQKRIDADTTSLSEAHLKKSLQEARDDVENLREELKAYVKENARMQRKLEQQAAATPYSVIGQASSSNPLHLDDLQRQNDALSQEVEGLRSRLKQYAQMQELASMLQESHKSLVQTNDHLLKEMEEERRRHRQGVDQMNWSYEPLKKSVSYVPSSVKGDSTLNLNANNSALAGHYRDGDR